NPETAAQGKDLALKVPEQLVIGIIDFDPLPPEADGPADREDEAPVPAADQHLRWHEPLTDKPAQQLDQSTRFLAGCANVFTSIRIVNIVGINSLEKRNLLLDQEPLQLEHALPPSGGSTD